MKKITLILILATLTISAWAQKSSVQPFGIKSGYMKTDTYQGKKVTSENLLWFDDYGRLAKYVTKMDMGEPVGLWSATTIMNGEKNWIINADGAVQEGTGRPEIVFGQLTPEMKAKMKFKDLGTETYKGKTCNKYYYEIKQMGMKSKITSWVWKGLILKQQIKQTFGSFNIELSELQENVPVPASTFKVPKSK